MKNYLIIFLIIFMTNCKAQTVIIPIGSGNNFEKTPMYYLKDVDNEFDKFTGNWLHQNGNTIISIILKKETQYQVSDDSNYLDLLVGEYRFVENGIEKINSLSSIDDNSISGYEHSIAGRVLIHSLPSSCFDNSQISEKKILVNINNPNNINIEGVLIMRYTNENGIEKLYVCIQDRTNFANDPNATFNIPNGNYEFIKQD